MNITVHGLTNPDVNLKRMHQLYIGKWFASYSSERRQHVIINGQSSDWVHILAGVPQGSILDQLLFLNWINDILNKLDIISACLPTINTHYYFSKGPRTVLMNNCP